VRGRWIIKGGGNEGEGEMGKKGEVKVRERWGGGNEGEGEMGKKRTKGVGNYSKYQLLPLDHIHVIQIRGRRV
jgi:hypothetical protein